MFRWLPRYVKQINILGVSIELREIPAEEALPLLSAPRPPGTSAAEQAEAAPVVRRQDYVCVSGTSASSRRTPRELDLMADGAEIEFHVHAPGGSQPRLRVGRAALEEAFARWAQGGGAAGEMVVPGRTARKEAEAVFALDDSEEVEVQAGWWIWVGKQDLKAALAELGVRTPW